MQFLGVEFNCLGLREVVDSINNKPNNHFSYIVTPNADHLVRLAQDPKLRSLYDGAWLRLLDSRFVARVAKLFGKEAPPVVTGSDLTAALVKQAVTNNEWVTVIGMFPEEARALRQETGLLFHHHNPPMGFEQHPLKLLEAVYFIESHQSHLIFLAVGSPRQEILANLVKERGIATGTALCIGASLRFLAGLERRAPRCLQRLGLEWAWRLAQDPRRLWRRYFVTCPAIFGMLRQ